MSLKCQSAIEALTATINQTAADIICKNHDTQLNTPRSPERVRRIAIKAF